MSAGQSGQASAHGNVFTPSEEFTPAFAVMTLLERMNPEILTARLKPSPSEAPGLLRVDGRVENADWVGKSALERVGTLC